MDNPIFQFNKHVSGEEYTMWRNYLESKDEKVIVLPEYLDYIDTKEKPFLLFGEGEEEGSEEQ